MFKVGQKVIYIGYKGMWWPSTIVDVGKKATILKIVEGYVTLQIPNSAICSNLGRAWQKGFTSKIKNIKPITVNQQLLFSFME